MAPLKDIAPSAIEVALLQDIEEEFFNTRCPEVHVIPVTRTSHSNFDTETNEEEQAPVTVRANWDWNSRIRELQDGVWQNTRKMEVMFHRKTIEDNNIPLKQGNLIDLNPSRGEKYKILRTKGKSTTIKRADPELHIVAVIDLNDGWE